tara:strand:- start:3146 stop:4207 length:1062 start_codon:yes stop_codon:yes gene_type:complete
MLKRTPLFNVHCESKARFGPFGDWEMPLWFEEGIKSEVKSVREDAGVFDVSHMGEFLISGKKSLDFLQSLLTNDIRKIEINQAQYNLMLNEKGGVIDDLIVYRLGLEDWRLVVNASNTEAGKKWISSRLIEGVSFRDETDEWSLIALQGPKSSFYLKEVGFDVESLGKFKIKKGEIDDIKVEIARTGYTGEDGFEIFVRPMEAESIYRKFLNIGAAPIGLGARDALRLEVCYPLHGHEISLSINPIEANLNWAVKFEKGDFSGRKELLSYIDKKKKRKIFALLPEVPVREGSSVYFDNLLVGKVTSGLYSPTLKKPIALALLEDFDENNKEVLIKKGKRFKIATLCKKPFYRR